MTDGRPDFVLAAPARMTLAGGAAGGADETGRFSCIASIFEQRVQRLAGGLLLLGGCFDESLAQRGLPALVWSHDWNTPPIGTTEACAQVGLNLEATARLFDSDVGLLRHLRLAMTERNADGRPPLREFSIGFDILDADWIERDGEEVLAVRRAALYEFGPCLVGAMDGTGFLRAPDAEQLLDRYPPRHRASRDRLEEAHARLRLRRP